MDKNGKIGEREYITGITKDGYTLVGWYKYIYPNYTEIKWNFDEDIVTDSIIILYAKWE